MTKSVYELSIGLIEGLTVRFYNATWLITLFADDTVPNFRKTTCVAGRCNL